MKAKLICVHIGARAHFLIPKALQSNGDLFLLVTDTWIGSAFIRRVLNKIPFRLIKSLAQRYSASIPSVFVRSYSLYFLILEVYIRLYYKNEWGRILARNTFFQRWANTIVQRNQGATVFGISYTSLAVFRTAKECGVKTILYQMDPGEEEERIVESIVESNKDLYPTDWKKAPANYWIEWKEECRLADRILVNSEWTRQSLLKNGISSNKIDVLALPFELKEQHHQFNRTYPERFSSQRPLRCLFLGTLTLRKGIQFVLEAAKEMKGRPVEFILVGHNELSIDWSQHTNVSYKGVCSRYETDAWYQQADLFLFPTLSDGFGLTQLEAMAWQMPVVASTFCGDVVVDGINGLLMKECSSISLIQLLEVCISDKTMLPGLSANCLQTVGKFSIKHFSEKLTKIIQI